MLIFPPPPIRGLGNNAGFQLQLEDRGGVGLDELNRLVQEVVEDASTQSGLRNVNSTFRAAVPQLLADVDREKVKTLDLRLTDVFTSRSTGAPKGALLEQRGMVNHLFAKVDALGLTAGDVVAQTASQCFDISVWQMLVALIVGGRTRIVPDAQVRDLAASIAELARGEVTVVELVPSLLRAVVEELRRTPGSIRSLERLRWMVPTGEALPPPLCRDWLELLPKVPLLNAYGPTECSDDVTHHRLDAAPPGTATPIGTPVINTRAYVLDPSLTPRPVGGIGELFIGGDGVGRGYLGRPDLTADRFLPDPFGPPGSRMYATGDRCRRLPDGTIVYLGRGDDQVKVHGFRIELSDVETALREQRGVRDGVVTAHRGPDGDTRLVAYVVEAAPGAASAASLKAGLAERLPAYMVPSAVVHLDALPLGSTGKVDRKALPAPALAETDADPVAPRNPGERMLLRDLRRGAAAVAGRGSTRALRPRRPLAARHPAGPRGGGRAGGPALARGAVRAPHRGGAGRGGHPPAVRTRAG